MLRSVILLALLGQVFLVEAQTKADDREALVRRLLSRGKVYKALSQCNDLLHAGRPEPRFWVLRADALNRIGEHANALVDARASLQAFPGKEDAILQLAIAELGTGAVDSAVVHFERLSTARTEPAVQVQLAEGYLRQGRCPEAVRTVEAIAGGEAAHTLKLHLVKGECAAMQGDSATARREFDLAVAEAPRDPVVYNSRGYHAYAHFGQHQQAIADYDRAIKLNPNYSYAFNNRGWSWYKLGQRSKALKDIQMAERRRASNPVVYRHLGVIELDGGDTTRACVHLRRAIELGYTTLYGPEVEQLVAKSCAAVVPATVPPPVKAPAEVPKGNAPGGGRTNAP